MFYLFIFPSHFFCIINNSQTNAILICLPTSERSFFVCFLKMTIGLIKIISVCFYGGSESLQISYRLFVNVLPLKFQLSRGKGQDSIYRFTQQHVCVCSKPEPGILTLYMYVVVICCIHIQYTYIVGKYKIYLYELQKQAEQKAFGELFMPVSQQINFIFNNNARILCLSCNVKKAGNLVRFRQKGQKQASFLAFHKCCQGCLLRDPRYISTSFILVCALRCTQLQGTRTVYSQAEKFIRIVRKVYPSSTNKANIYSYIIFVQQMY